MPKLQTFYFLLVPFTLIRFESLFSLRLSCFFDDHLWFFMRIVNSEAVWSNLIWIGTHMHTHALHSIRMFFISLTLFLSASGHATTKSQSSWTLCDYFNFAKIGRTDFKTGEQFCHHIILSSVSLLIMRTRTLTRHIKHGYLSDVI